MVVVNLVLGALIVGVFAGGATLAIGQIAFATVRTPLVRVLIGLLYAVPAGIAGYQASLGLGEIGVPSEGWREALAIVGAVLVGATAFAHDATYPAVGRAPHCGRSRIAIARGRVQGRLSIALSSFGWASAWCAVVRMIEKYSQPSPGQFQGKRLHID